MLIRLRVFHGSIPCWPTTVACSQSLSLNSGFVQSAASTVDTFHVPSVSSLSPVTEAKRPAHKPLSVALTAMTRDPAGSLTRFVCVQSFADGSSLIGFLTPSINSSSSLSTVMNSSWSTSAMYIGVAIITVYVNVLCYNLLLPFSTTLILYTSAECIRVICGCGEAPLNLG